MFIAYLWNNDSAARWLIAWSLGGYIYISSEKILKKWNKILEFGSIFWIRNMNFLHKNNVVSQPALAMGLRGICIMEKILWENDAIWWVGMYILI